MESNALPFHIICVYKKSEEKWPSGLIFLRNIWEALHGSLDRKMKAFSLYRFSLFLYCMMTQKRRRSFCLNIFSAILILLHPKKVDSWIFMENGGQEKNSFVNDTTAFRAWKRWYDSGQKSPIYHWGLNAASPKIANLSAHTQTSRPWMNQLAWKKRSCTRPRYSQSEMILSFVYK